MGFLERVLEEKRREINRSRDYVARLERMIEERERDADFVKALTSCRTKIIAEVKKASPSAGTIRDVSPSEQARLYEEGGAVAVSVLTDRKFFRGSLEDLREVSRAVSVPVLRKDFILDEVQVLEAKAYGADTLLLIVRMLDNGRLRSLLSMSRELGMEPLVEVFSLEEAERALEAGAQIVGINNRDLDTLRVDVSLTVELAPKIKELGARFVIAESGIETRRQVEELMGVGVDAFLVGTSLMRSPDPLEKLRELLGFGSGVNL